MDNKVKIITPTQEEVERVSKEFAECMAWAQSLTENQIAFLCDGGWYNNAIEGYLILAAQEANFTKEQIKALKKGLKSALDWHSKTDADKASKQLL